MSDLGWRADGISRAEAAGGVVLELYRRPGFTREQAVRQAGGGAHAQGFETWADDPDPEPWASGKEAP